MEILIIVKCLFFLEGLLLMSFSPRILLESARQPFTAMIEYSLGYILGFGWIWYADQSRAIAPTLITCLVLSMTLKWYLNEILANYLADFLRVFSTSMIIPLTCASTARKGILEFSVFFPHFGETCSYFDPWNLFESTRFSIWFSFEFDFCGVGGVDSLDSSKEFGSPVHGSNEEASTDLYANFRITRSNKILVLSHFRPMRFLLLLFHKECD